MALTPTAVANSALSKRDTVLLTSLQTNYGAINTSPVFETVRRVSGGTIKKVNYTQSGEIVAGYNPQNQVQSGIDLTCAFETEASKQTIKYLIEALYAEDTSYTNTASTFASLVNGFTVPAATYAALSAGDGFWVNGFANTLISGFYFVASKSGGTTIVTTIAPVATEAAGASVTIKSNKHLNSNDPYYRTFQTATTDLSTVSDVSRHTVYDAIPNTGSVSIPEEGAVTGSFEYMAEREVSGYEAIAGQTVTAAPTDLVVSAVDGVEAFYVNGVSATCLMKSLDLSISLAQAGDNAAACGKRYSRGTPEFTGSAVLRALRDAPFTWRNYAHGATRVSVACRMSHGGTDETVIVFTRCVVTEATPDLDADIVTTSASFSAELDTTLGYSVGVFTNWTV